VGILHTVNKSPFERNALASCLRHARPGSAILLLEDAVYAAARGTTWEEGLVRALGKVSVHVLDADLRGRGLDPAGVIEGVTVVDHGGFVDLVVTHDKVQSWL
jgi:tRNA 2-thiouridine synthesizing protein B